MKALIDGDIFSYAFGACTNDEGHPLSWPLVASRMDAQITNIVDQSGADSYKIFLTSDDKSNYRIKAATIKPYKGHRKQEKPFWYEQIRRHLTKFRKAEIITQMEADDALGIHQNKDTIICSLDKDLNMIPGKHYNWSKEIIYDITDVEGIRNFYKQLLTGDTVDNILGLFGVGQKSTLVQKIDSLENELDMYNHVKEQYQMRFGSYWSMFLNENATLLWILRSSNVNEAKERLEMLERSTIDPSLNQPLLNS